MADFTLQKDEQQGFTLAADQPEAGFTLAPDAPGLPKYGVQQPSAELPSPQILPGFEPHEARFEPRVAPTMTPPGRMAGIQAPASGDIARQILTRAGVTTPGQPGLAPWYLQPLAVTNLPFAAAGIAAKEATGGVSPVEGLSPQEYTELLTGAGAMIGGPMGRATRALEGLRTEGAADIAARLRAAQEATFRERMGQLRTAATKVEEPTFAMKTDILPSDAAIQMGMRYDGVTQPSSMHPGLKEPMHWFTDPATGSTLMLPESKMTPEGITAKVNESRKAFGKPPLGEGVEAKMRTPDISEQVEKMQAPPELTNAAGLIKGAAQEVKDMLNPMASDLTGQEMARIMREHLGEMQHNWDKMDAALSAAKNYFNNRAAADNFKFIDNMERGLPQATPELEDIAMSLRDQLDRRREAIMDLGKGYLENFYENYFPHMYEQPGPVREFFTQLMARRPLGGKAEFLKQRKYQFLSDAMQAGKVPVSTNPVDFVLLKARSMDKFLMSQKLKQSLKDAGFAKFVRLGQHAPDGWVPLESVFAPPVTKGGRFELQEAFDQGVRDKLNKLADDLGLRVKRVQTAEEVAGRGTWGASFRQRPDITMKFGGPNSAIAHEIGHQIDRIYGLKEFFKDPRLDEELTRLSMLRVAEGADPSADFINYLTSPDEKMAMMLESLIHAPDTFKQTAPNAYNRYVAMIQSDPKLRQIMDIKPTLQLGHAYLPVEGKAVKGIGPQLVGRYFIPEGAGRIVDNYLSPGLQRFKMYQAIRTWGNELNQFQLGLSAFHLGFTSNDAAISRMALGLEQALGGRPVDAFKSFAVTPVAPGMTLAKGQQVMRAWYSDQIQDPILAKIVDGLQMANARVKMDSYYQTQISEKMVRAFHSSNPLVFAFGGVLRAPFAAMEQAARPMMEWLVPRQKLGVAYDMLHDFIQTNPNATRIELRNAAQKIWDSVDNRMGQLVYDNLFWNKTFKDLAMIGVRSVGWNIGTLRELGGGSLDFLKAGANIARLKKPEFTHRMAYTAALPMMVALQGAIYNYIRGQVEGHDAAPMDLKDYFFWKTGRKNPDGSDERIDPPTYMRDVSAFADDPVRTVSNKLQPLLGSVGDMLRNQDFYGVQIRNAEDPWMKQAMQLAQYGAKQFEPFGVRYMLKAKDTYGWDDPMTWLPFGGYTPAPSYITQTPAYRMATKMQAETFPRGARTPEEFDRSQLQKEYVTRLQKAQTPLEKIQILGEMREAIRSSELALGAGKRIAQRTMDAQPIAAKLRGLPVKDLFKIYDVAAPVEREAIRQQLPRAFSRDRSMMSLQEAKDALSKISTIISEGRNAH